VTRTSWRLLVAGPLLGLVGLLVVGDVATAPWRVIALPSALGAVAAGLAELTALAGGEWRRERPKLHRYGIVVGLFVASFVLAVTATR
jgi:hypothetical protein